MKGHLRAGALLLPLFLAGCGKWVAAPALPSAAEGFREEAEVRLETPYIRGVYHGVLVARGGAHPAVRLQLFPPVGGRLFDLIATPDRIAGSFPQAEVRWDHRPPRPGEVSFAMLVGLTLLEIAGARPEGLNVEIRPEQLSIRRLDWGWVRWTLAPGDPMAVRGGSIRIEVSGIRREPMIPADSVFDFSTLP